jgi:uncharacterized membrane protein
MWAVGYESMERADQVRGEVARLGDRRALTLLDAAVVVRYADGSVTLNGEPYAPVAPARGVIASILAGLALGAPPLCGEAVGALLSRVGGAAAAAGIDEDFIREVEGRVKPGTFALFVLDREGDMEEVLRGIRGLGGTVMKTNVDLERANLVQSALAATAPEAPESDSRQDPSVRSRQVGDWQKVQQQTSRSGENSPPSAEDRQ